jgi:hypothetical protein
MPRLPQYISTAQPSGIVRGVVPSSPNVGGLVAGITQGAHAVQRGEDIRAAQMERERQRIAEEEAKAAVSLTMSEGRAHWTEQLVNAQQNTADAAGFTQRTLKDFDAWSQKAIEAAPEDARSHLAARLQDLKLSVHERAFSFEADSRRAKVVDDFSTGLDAARRTAQADPSQFATLMAEQLAAANALTLDPKSKAKLLESTRETIAFDTASGIVGRDPDAFLAMSGMAGGKSKDGKPLPSDPEKAAKAVSDNPILSNLRPEHLHSLVERATMLSVTRQAALDAERERQARRAEANAERIGREQDRAWLIVSDRLRNGIPTDPSAPELRVLQGSPYAAEYQARIGEMAARASVAGLPIDQQQARLDQLKAQQLKGSNKQLDREIEQSQQILDGAKSAYKAEPLRAGADRGIIATPTPLDVSNLDAAIAGMPARVEQAKMVETRTRQAVSPFLAPEADAIANQLQALGWDERGKRIGQLAAGMTPQQAQAFASQIDPKNRVLALELSAGTSRTDSGKYVAQWIGRGQQFLKDKPQDGEKASAVRNDIAKAVGESLSGKTREDTIDAAYYAYMGQKDAGLRPSSDGVVSLVLGGPLVEHNGRSIPVPQDIDLPKALRTGAYLAPSGPVFVNGRQISEAEFRAMLPDAQLEPAGFGRYTVRAGDGLVLDANRKPVRISVIK